jgi:hypothetical protein
MNVLALIRLWWSVENNLGPVCGGKGTINKN